MKILEEGRISKLLTRYCGGKVEKLRAIKTLRTIFFFKQKSNISSKVLNKH